VRYVLIPTGIHVSRLREGVRRVIGLKSGVALVGLKSGVGGVFVGTPPYCTACIKRVTARPTD
jgi:hypothetical protein